MRQLCHFPLIRCLSALKSRIAPGARGCKQSLLGLKLTAWIGTSMDRLTPDQFESFKAEVVPYPEANSIEVLHAGTYTSLVRSLCISNKSIIT